MTVQSSSSNQQVSTWLFGNTYQKGLQEEIKWRLSWADHYFSKNDYLGIFFGAIEVICIKALSCPIINEITYIALSILSPSHTSRRLENAINKQNPTAAFILITQNRSEAEKTLHGQAVLSLFAKKAEKEKTLSTKDLETCILLCQKTHTIDLSEEGFSTMLEIALEKKNQPLVLLLLKRGVKLKKPWTAYLPLDQETFINLPNWSKTKLPTIELITPYDTNIESPIGSDFNACAARFPVQKHFVNKNALDKLIRVYEKALISSPVILGESPAERSRLLSIFTHHILSNKAPPRLTEKRIVSISIDTLERLNSLNEYNSLLNAYQKTLKANPHLILYLHGFDSFADQKKLSPLILRKIVEWAKKGRVILSMKPRTYTKLFKEDESAKHCFTLITMREPTDDETLLRLYKTKPKLESRHHIFITHRAIEHSIVMSKRSKASPFFKEPLRLLDVAALFATKQKSKGSFPLQKIKKKREALINKLHLLRLKNNPSSKKKISETERDIAIQTAEITQLEERDQREIEEREKYFQLLAQKAVLTSLSAEKDPFFNAVQQELKQFETIKREAIVKFEVDSECIDQAFLSEESNNLSFKPSRNDPQKFASLEKTLSEQIIGQKEAIRAVSNAMMRMSSGFQDPSKPIVLMFAGPTGVGKTELAKMLAKEVFGSERAITRFDLSEFVGEQSKTRLIGAPPGYVGYDHGGALTNAFQKEPNQIVLIDEFEKASPEVTPIFLQVFGEGRLTDGKGNTIDCTNAIFIITTNLGSHELLMSQTKMPYWQKLLGYKKPPRLSPQDILLKALLASPHFPPELINRIDDCIPFLPLKNASDLKKIAEINLKTIQKQLSKGPCITLSWTSNTLEYLAESGINPEFGARPLKRLIQNEIQTPLAKKFTKKEIQLGEHIEIDYDQNKKCLTFNSLSKPDFKCDINLH